MLSNHELKQRLSYLILGQRGGLSRVQIIEALKDRPYNINQLAAMLDLNYRTVKHHVDMLLKHGLIGTSRTGGYGEVYFLSPELEARLPMFQEISQKLKTVTTSPKFFQNVIEQTNDAVVVIDEKLEVLYWNRSAEDLYGYRADEVAGTRIPVFPDAEALRGVLKMISEGKKVVGLETQARTKAGALLDVAITIDGIKDEGDRPVGYSLISTDITERRRALEALLVSQQRYALAQQAAGIISWEWDPGTDAMKWSDRLGPFLGLGQSFRADTLRSFLKCVPAQDMETVSKATAAAVKLGREIAFEHRVRRPDGSIRWVRHTGGVLRDENGKALRLLGILQDFTDRRDAERRYARILETSLDGFWINDMKGRFLEANDACCRMLGYGRQELLRMSIQDIEGSEKPAETMRHIQKVMKKGADRFETRHRRKDGRAIDVEVSATFLDSEGGRLVVFVRDVTERKRADEQIRHMASFPLLNPNPILELDLSGEVIYSNASAGRIVREAGLKSASALMPPDMPAVLAELAKHPGSTVYRDVPLGSSVFRFSIFHPRGLDVFRVYSIDITGLVRAEEELRRSEERFRAVATQTPDHILMQDAELRYQLVVNPQMGLTEKDMIGKRDQDLLSSEDADRLTEIKKKVLRTGKPEHVSLPLTAPSGEKQFFEGSYIPKRGADGRVDGVIGYFRNITERVRMEETLAESEEKYRLLFKRMQTGFALHEIITDKAGNPVDYRFLELNPAFEELTGLKASQTVGKTVLEVLPGTEPFWIETYGKVALTGRSTRFERYFPPLDRHYSVLAYCPQKGRFAVLFNDITERKKTEEERDKLLDRLNATTQDAIARAAETEAVLSSMADPVMVVDQKGLVLRANRPAVDFHGFEVAGIDVDEIVRRWSGARAGEKAPDLQGTALYRALRGETVRDMMRTITDAAGRQHEQLVSAAPITKGGKIVGAVASWHDISDLKMAERSLAESESRFKRLFESMPCGVVYQDADGKIILANPAAEKILGLSLDQMQGRTSMHPDWRAIREDGSPFPGDEHPSMVALRTGKLQQNVIMGVYNPQKKDCTWIIINAVPQFRPGEDRPYEVFTTFEDITGQGKAGQAGPPVK